MLPKDVPTQLCQACQSDSHGYSFQQVILQYMVYVFFLINLFSYSLHSLLLGILPDWLAKPPNTLVHASAWLLGISQKKPQNGFVWLNKTINTEDKYVFQVLGRVALTNRLKSSKKGEGGHFQSKNLYCRFWTFIQDFKKRLFVKIVIWFYENEGRGGKGRLDFFRKFIQFRHRHPALIDNAKMSIIVARIFLLLPSLFI